MSVLDVYINLVNYADQSAGIIVVNLAVMPGACIE